MGPIGHFDCIGRNKEYMNTVAIGESKIMQKQLLPLSHGGLESPGGLGIFEAPEARAFAVLTPTGVSGGPGVEGFHGGIRQEVMLEDEDEVPIVKVQEMKLRHERIDETIFIGKFLKVTQQVKLIQNINSIWWDAFESQWASMAMVEYSTHFCP